MSLYISVNAFLGKDEKMSKAKVCDRCGEVYSVSYDDSYRVMPIKIRHGWDYGKNTDYFEEDLCVECAKEFDNFMKRLYTTKITRTDNTDHNEEEN